MSASVPELFARGARAIDTGDHATAAEAYMQVVAADPGQADAWFNLGWLHRSARRFNVALDAYAQAIAAGVERPEEAHLNRAAILSDHLFRPEAAIAELRTALALDARFVPAWISLGTIEEDLGRADQARQAYRAAIVIDPGNGRAHGRLATLDTLAGQAPAAVAVLQAALPLAPSADDRADMLFALGTALDAQAEYDRAFQAFEAGNLLARSVARTPYDPGAHERLVDALIAAFPRAGASPRSAVGTVPVFICGMFRSGSTLAEQILGRHLAVASRGELEAIPALVASLPDYPSAGSDGQWRDLRARYVAELGTLPADARVWTDKRCDNYLHIGAIKAIFPEAVIVETVRQPLDNLLSAWFLRFGEGVTHAHDLAAAAHHYVQYRRLMAHWYALYPGSIHRFDYDQAVAAPRATIGALLTALDLPWDDACLAPERGTGPVRTASAWQVRQPLHSRSSGRWRHYEKHLDEARAILTRAGL